MGRIAFIAGAVVLGTGLLWRFPLFHVVHIEETPVPQQASVFNAREFAEDYWQTRLTPRLVEAADAATVLTAMQTDARQVRTEFGHTVGIGRSSYFLLRGRGTIVSLQKNAIGVA